MRNGALLVLTLLLSTALYAQTHGGGGYHSSGPAANSGPSPIANRGPMRSNNAPAPLASANDEGKIEFRASRLWCRFPSSSHYRSRVNFDFVVAAYAFSSKDGKATKTMGKTFTPTLNDAQLAEVRSKGVGFKYAIDLAPGQYSVRLVIRDNISGKVGSVTAPLRVN